ncbi:two-component sensor histidine kinase [Richelia sinica FACHB-800]|uniref:histidine kinase n=1 Tax=Richelia sinica FACHB-800 TaxID=1357546 RepID=A0A975T982_9NOST|nr:HAMP domain-containing sensor histidine kinase [Richelia sinica]MBD2664987.1 PAS domain S-box protein [Richelia sinica FACHB-800]QXE24369.1 two-component sensor histidine kinase [Richelia sinica FACHB-800]
MNFDESALIQPKSQLTSNLELECKLAKILINQTIEAAFCINENTDFVYVNEAFCKLTEFSREELLSMKIANIDVDFSVKNWLQQWQLLFMQKKLSFSSRYRTKNSQILEVEIMMTYIKYQDVSFICAFVHKNIDKLTSFSQKELYSALENTNFSDLQSNFLPILFHQLRVPLNIISFSNSLLKHHTDGLLLEKIKPLIDHIQTAVDQLNSMVEDILLLAKIKSTGIYVDSQIIDLVEFCDNLLSQLKIINSEKNINFISKCTCTKVRINQQILQPILQNLLENAIKYSPLDQAVDLILICGEEKVIFQVQDRGIGIPAIDKSRLFEPFYRGRNVENIPGAGVGLSIVKTLVDLYQGEIILDSTVGVGSTFTVILPLLKSNAGEKK